MKKKIYIFIIAISIIFLFMFSKGSFANLSVTVPTFYNPDGATFEFSNFLSGLKYYYVFTYHITTPGYTPYYKYRVFLSNYPIRIRDYRTLEFVDGQAHDFFTQGYMVTDSSDPNAWSHPYNSVFPDNVCKVNYDEYDYNEKSHTDSSFDYFNCLSIVSNTDLYDVDNNLIHKNVKFPSFKNSIEDFESGSFENIDIDCGSLEPFVNNDKFYLHTAKVNRPILEDSSAIYYVDEKVFLLDWHSPYFTNNSGSTYNYFSVPKSKTGFSFDTGNEYCFVLSSSSSSISSLTKDEIYEKKLFVVGARSDNEVQQDKQDIMNDKLDEQNKTSKGIWDTLKDLLSYINPLSPNFFVYKLIELLIEGLKSLFIPSDDFFETYFNELKDFFSERLGFLFYPFELIIDVLTKMLNVNFSEPVFTIPDMYEPVTGNKLISSTQFNLNSMLGENAFKVVHDIYLVLVDAFIVFKLVNLFKDKYEEVVKK